MKIQVVGQENALQKRLLKNVLDAIKELHCGCELDVVHELKEILEMEKSEFLITPALIVNSHILCEGHVWDKDHIKHFLEEAVKENSG
jgi:hypothetical protein